MAEPLRHRQTKGAETDMPSLPPPRHIPTLPMDAGLQSVRDQLRWAGTVVIIDLEQYFDAIYGQDRAVVLAVRVIVIGECIESRNCSENMRNGSEAQ